MSIFLKCCGKNESKDSIDLNQSDESYDKAKSNLNSEREEENRELVEKVIVPEKSETVDSFIKVAQFKKQDEQVDGNREEEEIQEIVEEVQVAKKTATVDAFIRVAEFERDGQQVDDNGNFKDVW